MRYDTTISYQNKKVNIKVTNKAYSGEFQLPNFLKAVRIAKGQDFNQLNANMKDWSPQDCEAFENGELPIPRKYISFFCIWYFLPVKLVNLGVDDDNEQQKESPLALRLRELRLKHGYTQEQIATIANVSRPAYSLYEISKNTPDISTLVKIANVYGVSLDYLVDRKYE